MSSIIVATLYCGKSSEESFLNINDLLVDSIEVSFELNLEDTFDYILCFCAKKCNINPSCISLFGLQDVNSNWLNLARTVKSYIKDHECLNNHVDNTSKTSDNTSPVIKLEFRIRYVFQSECKVGEKSHYSQRKFHQSFRGNSQDFIEPVMSSEVIKYFFHQQRSDFLKGYLPLNADLSFDEDGTALGIALMDLWRLAAELNCSLKNTYKQLGNYMKLLPQSCCNRLNSHTMLNRIRLKCKFKQSMQCVDLETTKNPLLLYQKYLRNLELLSGTKQIESYKIVLSESSVSNSIVKVSGDCGIMLCGDNVEDEKWCDFTEITDMRIQAGENEHSNISTVSISQLCGKIIKLAFNSQTTAENFASCVNGYYMLVKDAHHYLCRTVTSPSVVERLHVHCHGPILGMHAEYILRNQSLPREGDCLLRQSYDSHDEYFINTIIEISANSEVIVRNYKLDREHGKLGIYGDSRSHVYDDLHILLESYSTGEHQSCFVPFNLDRLIHPSTESQGNLKVCRCTHIRLSEDLKEVTVIPMEYTFKKFLKIGKYITTSLYSHKQSKKKVVFKRVNDPNPTDTHELTVKPCVDKSFQAWMWNQNKLKNDFILRLIGKVENMWALEYVPFRSIIDYFYLSQKEKSSDQDSLDKRKYCWYLHVVWQLAHACTFLEEKGIAHGNIKGKNVLLQQFEPDPYIKLADPSATKHLVQLEHGTSRVSNELVPLLPAPWLAREFCWVDGIPTSPTYSYPTVGADKWSFATTVCEICDFGNLPVQICAASCINNDLQIRYLAGEPTDLPEVISGSNILSQLIKQCWSVCSQNRPPFKVILREVGAMLSSDYALRVATATTAINIQAFEDYTEVFPTDLPNFEDRSLVFIKMIGQGHFSRVGLYRYDDPLFKGEREVAVKKLLPTENNRSLDIEFANEVEIMRRLDSKYIVKLRGIAEPSLRIVMEYLPRGSLSKYLTNKKRQGLPFSCIYNQLLNFARQIADGMNALQKQRLIHRDLALRNILLAEEADSLLVKISDFGLSRILKKHTDYYRGDPNDFPALWYAPECLKNEKIAFRFESDIWSYGVTLWEMFSYNKTPEYIELQAITASALLDILKQGIRLPKPLECPEEVYKLIGKCWKFEPDQRPKFENLCQYFDDIIRKIG